MSGRPAKARTRVHRKHLEDGAWVIECQLCGKRFRRVFRADKYEDTAKAAGEYVGEHLDSGAHAAAVDAYRDVPQDQTTETERTLRALFGEVSDERSDEQKRKAAARRAAEAWRP